MSSDITACSGEGCSIRESCHRYTNPRGEYQSFFTTVPGKQVGSKWKCDMYWGNFQESIHQHLKEISNGNRNKRNRRENQSR